MSFKTLETAVLAEARTVLKRPKLRHKDILEWSTSEASVRRGAQPGEKVTHLPHLNVWIATKEGK